MRSDHLDAKVHNGADNDAVGEPVNTPDGIQKYCADNDAYVVENGAEGKNKKSLEKLSDGAEQVGQAE